jgi:hypothetical protein
MASLEIKPASSGMYHSTSTIYATALQKLNTAMKSIISMVLTTCISGKKNGVSEGYIAFYFRAEN